MKAHPCRPRAERVSFAALTGLVACGAYAAPVLTVDLPPAAGGRFSWAQRADGRHELRVDQHATVMVANPLPKDAAFESNVSGSQRVVVLRLPIGSAGLAVSGNRIVIGEAASELAPAATTSPAAAATMAAPPASAAASAAGVANAPLDKNLKAKADEAVSSFKNYRVDMSVPSSPAFTVLGGTPEIILQPKSPRDLAVSLVNNLSDDDKLAKGVGFDVAPYMLWRGKGTTLGAYQARGSALPILANLQVSFGAIKTGSGDQEKVTRVALGLTAPLLDEGDPRAPGSMLADCFRKAVAKVLAVKQGSTAVPPWVIAALKKMKASEEPELAEVSAQLSAEYDSCRETFKQLTWSATRWTVGLGEARHNRGAGGHAGTYGLWTTYSRDLTAFFHGSGAAMDTDTPRSQALLHLRRMGREEVDSDTDARGFRLRRGTLVAAGLRYGSDVRNFSLEGSLYRARYDNGERETSRKLALGGEIMINKDLWLVLTIGGEGGLKNGKNSPFALAGLKFGTASEPTEAFAPR